jgi:hypothetical protein
VITNFKERADFLRGLYSRNREGLAPSLLLWLNSIEGARKRLLEADQNITLDPAARGAEYQAVGIDLLTIGEFVSRDFVLAELQEAAARLELMRMATEGKP